MSTVPGCLPMGGITAIPPYCGVVQPFATAPWSNPATPPIPVPVPSLPGYYHPAVAPGLHCPTAPFGTLTVPSVPPSAWGLSYSTPTPGLYHYTPTWPCMVSPFAQPDEAPATATVAALAPESALSKPSDVASSASKSPTEPPTPTPLHSGSSSNEATGTHHTTPCRHGSILGGVGMPDFDVAASNRAVAEKRQLIVKFLTDETSERQFYDLFRRFGPLENARIVYDRKTTHTKGFGFVTFRHAEHAAVAVRAMSAFPLHGRQLNVALAQTERRRTAFSGDESTR